MNDLEKDDYVTALVVESVKVLNESRRIRDCCEKYHNDIEQFIEKYPEETVLSMDVVSRERVLGEAEILFENLRQMELEMSALDDQYEIIRGKVNEFYGREVMPPVCRDSLNL